MYNDAKWAINYKTSSLPNHGQIIKTTGKRKKKNNKVPEGRWRCKKRPQREQMEMIP